MAVKSDAAMAKSKIRQFNDRSNDLIVTIGEEPRNAFRALAGKSDPDGGPHSRQEECFRQRLADQTAASRADGKPDGEFPLACSGPAKHEVRYCHACSQ